MPSPGSRKGNRHRLLRGGLIEVTLTRGRVTIIDAADAWLLLDYTWCAARFRKRWYACSGSGRRRGGITLLHRLLLPDAVEVDHKNGDGLDNRRSNLRAVDRLGNLRSHRDKHRPTSSCYRGVVWDKVHQRWKARFYPGAGESPVARTFRSEEEAARWWDAQVVEHWGEANSLNFPPTKQ